MSLKVELEVIRPLLLEFDVATYVVVVILLNLDIRLSELDILREGETEILDGHSCGNPLLFVVRADAEGGIGKFAVLDVGVEVGCRSLWLNGVLLEHSLSIGCQEWAVRLEVDKSLLTNELAVAGEHKSANESLAGLLHLRVGEGNPYLTDLTWRKKLLNELDARPEESHILESLLQSLCSTSMHARALDVNSNIIDARVSASQSYSIFSATTAELYDNRVAIAKPLIPLATHLETVLLHRLETGLEDMAILRHIGEFLKLILSQNFYYLIIWIARQAYRASSGSSCCSMRRPMSCMPVRLSALMP